MSTYLLEAIDNLSQQTDEVEAAIKSLRGTAPQDTTGATQQCCPVLVEWDVLIKEDASHPDGYRILLYVGNDGTKYVPTSNTDDPPVRYRYPLTAIGGGGFGGDIDQESGAGIVAAAGTIAGYEGNILTIPIIPTLNQHAIMCQKANWAVMAAEKCLSSMLDGLATTQDLIGLVAKAASFAGLLGGTAALVGTTTIAVASLPVITISAGTIAAAAAVLGTLAAVGNLFQVQKFVFDSFVEIRTQLIQAVYCGGLRSPAALKERWDEVIDGATTWYAPQRALFKFLMTPDLAKKLCDMSLACATGERYSYECSCPVASFTGGSVLTHFEWAGGSEDLWAIEWPTGFDRTNEWGGYTTTRVSDGSPAFVFNAVGLTDGAMRSNSGGLERVVPGRRYWFTPQMNGATGGCTGFPGWYAAGTQCWPAGYTPNYRNRIHCIVKSSGSFMIDFKGVNLT